MNEPFPGCTQVTFEGLGNAKDMDIWLWARQNDCCIVTFDSDFLDILTLKGFPPKVLFLRTGNRKTKELANIMWQRAMLIETFLADKNIACLQIHL